MVNPFTERGRITDPVRFAGRWGELALIFERLAAGRPVLLVGSPGIGVSSLLTHVVQSAAVNLERPGMRAHYLSLRGAVSAADVYQTIVAALGQRGDTAAALEVALVGRGTPLLVCLDDVQAAIAAGWGEALLDSLARVVRGGGLLLLAAITGPPPVLSERFALVSLGAMAATEVRLLVDSYLDAPGVTFTPAEMRALVEVSAAHPAYVQRAAFHLFQSKCDPSIDWRAAYLAEARMRPVPGAPLPPAIFEGGSQRLGERSVYGNEPFVGDERRLPSVDVLEVPQAVLVMVPLLVAALLVVLTGNVPLALLVVVASVAGGFWYRARRS